MMKSRGTTLNRYAEGSPATGMNARFPCRAISCSA